MNQRSLGVIVAEIRADWRKPCPDALPYLNAMAWLTVPHERYYTESGQDIILRFLCNAATWRGTAARRIKAELNAILKAAD